MIGCEVLGSFSSIIDVKFMEEENPSEQSSLGILFAKEITYGRNCPLTSIVDRPKIVLMTFAPKLTYGDIAASALSSTDVPSVGAG
ncbi:hypothetical protein Tco_0290300 [Tanacetum coccineum]